jgi:16S rRNA (guanine527-N7)-methyltransferase
VSARGGEHDGGATPPTPWLAAAPSLTSDVALALGSVLGQARTYGFLGPGPVDEQLHRAMAFAAVVQQPPSRAADLGTGGGLPGLVLASVWPTSEWILIDSNHRRCHWLEEALKQLQLGARCTVLCERAEVVGHELHRHQLDLVTARSFGPPAPTAECAAPLLRTGGQLVVADPPGIGPERWPAAGLSLLGMKWEESLQVGSLAGPVSLSRLSSLSRCPSIYPRRVGVPSKRPLF